MVILQINAVYGYGSTGNIVKNIDEILQQYKYESYIACANFSAIPKNGYKIGNIIDYKLHGLLTRLTGKQAYFSVISTKKLLRFINRIKPDIIHLHNLHSNYINLNMLLKYIDIHNISTVITLHDCWFFTGKCFHYKVAGCNNWETQCNDCPKLKDDVPSWFFDKTAIAFKDKRKYLSSLSDLTIVGVSEWISSEARKSFLRSKKIVTILNGVDLDIFKPTESDLRTKLKIEDKFIILGIANKWLDGINQNTFSYIINRLSEDEILVLVGCSKTQIEELPGNVVGIEFIENRQELAKIYSMADTFVNVTWEDSLPSVNLESVCCGTPVITFDSGGSPETIEKDTGLIVPQGDSEKLLEAIREVKRKSKKYYQQKCVEYGINNFNKNDKYVEYIDLYKKD